MTSARAPSILVAMGLVVLGATSCGGHDTSSDELLATARPASLVELKVTVDESQVALARDLLGLDHASAEVREVTFYDTPELAMFQAGVILRARKVIGGPDDVTAKIRPLAAEQVTRSWFALDGFKCEIDRTATRSTSSCSLKVAIDGDDIDDAADGILSVKKLFDDDQEDFLDGYAIDVPWDDVVPLGPIDALAWELEPEHLSFDLDAELWMLPDGLDVLELSTKVSAADADEAWDEMDAFLRDSGLDPSNRQETKTRLALECFADSL